MTDKQIIIDGVDVSGCSYHYKHTRVCLVKMDAAGRYYNCANWHDCDFKKLSQKLKRKEQECERSKQGYAELTEIVSPYMDDFTGYNEELGGFDIVLCVKQLMEQLDQLKEANEDLLSIQYKLADNNKRLRQTLTEIKEIVQKGVKIHDDIIVNKQILQICDEVNKDDSIEDDLSGHWLFDKERDEKKEE